MLIYYIIELAFALFSESFDFRESKIVNIKFMLFRLALKCRIIDLSIIREYKTPRIYNSIVN